MKLFILVLFIPSLFAQLKPVKVQGSSLAGLYENNTYVEADFNTNLVLKRNDIVIVEVVLSQLIIKKVYAVPGDSLKVEEVNGNVYFLVNEERIKTPNGKDLKFSQREKPMLNLMASSLKVPANSYILFGTVVDGYYDSSKFGFISKDQIKAKVIRKL